MAGGGREASRDRVALDSLARRRWRVQPRLVARDCAVAVCVNVRHHDVYVEVLVQAVLRLVRHELSARGRARVHCKPPPCVRRGAVRRGAQPSERVSARSLKTGGLDPASRPRGARRYGEPWTAASRSAAAPRRAARSRWPEAERSRWPGAERSRWLGAERAVAATRRPARVVAGGGWQRPVWSGKGLGIVWEGGV